MTGLLTTRHLGSLVLQPASLAPHVLAESMAYRFICQGDDVGELTRPARNALSSVKSSPGCDLSHGEIVAIIR